VSLLNFGGMSAKKVLLHLLIYLFIYFFFLGGGGVFSKKKRKRNDHLEGVFFQVLFRVFVPLASKQPRLKTWGGFSY
jgi:hypothetical protein